MKKFILIILLAASYIYGQQNLADIPASKAAGTDSLFAWEFNKVVVFLQDSVVYVYSVDDSADARITYALTQAKTITGNWVNTANPWADNEVADDITASNYLLLTAFGDSLTGNITIGNYLLKADFDDSLALGTVTQAYDANLDSLSATGNWKVFYSDGSGVLHPLAIGSNGTVLKSNGPSAAPSWQSDATGAGGSAYADSIVHDGRHVPGDSLITDAEGAARFEPLDAAIAKTDEAETLTANWVNTANPWADNEVADDITASNYLLLTAFDDSLTAYTGSSVQAYDATLTDIADGTIEENLNNTANPWADNEVANDLTIDSLRATDTTYVISPVKLQSTSGIYGLQALDIDTLKNTVALALIIGGGSETITVNSSDWDISATGAITGVAFDANGTGNSLSNVDMSADVTGTLPVANGGTGATTLTDGGILLGSGTGAITALGVATNGQIPIGDGTTDPQLATITGGNAITITNGAGSITAAVTAEAIEEAEIRWAGVTADSLVYYQPTLPAFGTSLDSSVLIAVDTVGIGFAPHSFTVDSVCVTSFGPTPNFTFQIVHGSTNLFSAAQTKNAAATTGYSTFNDATITAGSALYLHFPAVTTKPKTVQVVICGRWR